MVLVSEVDKEESHALSGWPGLTEIPGLNTVTNTDVQRNYASLLIIVTPHVIRGTQAAGHSPMMRIERGQIDPVGQMQNESPRIDRTESLCCTIRSGANA